MMFLICNDDFLPFHGTFSRHGITRASSVLLIWLNENLRFIECFLPFCLSMPIGSCRRPLPTAGRTGFP